MDIFNLLTWKQVLEKITDSCLVSLQFSTNLSCPVSFYVMFNGIYLVNPYSHPSSPHHMDMDMCYGEKNVIFCNSKKMPTSVNPELLGAQLWKMKTCGQITFVTPPHIGLN